jgi:hypothetical protein
MLQTAPVRTSNRLRLSIKVLSRIDIVAILRKSRFIKFVNPVELIDKWIAGTRQWERRYCGMTQLQDNINARLATACKRLKLNTARHAFVPGYYLVGIADCGFGAHTIV